MAGKKPRLTPGLFFLGFFEEKDAVAALVLSFVLQKNKIIANPVGIGEDAGTYRVGAIFKCG